MRLLPRSEGGRAGRTQLRGAEEPAYLVDHPVLDVLALDEVLDFYRRAAARQLRQRLPASLPE